MFGVFLRKKCYFCKQKVENAMSKSSTLPLSPHPIVALNAKIEERGVLLIEDVERLPSSDIPFVSPHLVIVICHQGHSIGEYDMKPIKFCAHDYIGLSRPSHFGKRNLGGLSFHPTHHLVQFLQ